MSDYAIRMATYAMKHYGTRNPFEIIDQRKINFEFTDNYKHLLGYFAVINNRRFIRINSNATTNEQLQGAAHELGHDFNDYKDARSQLFYQDTWLYSISKDAKEINANIFAAELLIPDENILEPIGYYTYYEFLHKVKNIHPNWAEKEILNYVNEEFQIRYGNYTVNTNKLASENGCDQYLIQHKYKALQEKGFVLPIEPELKSSFLKL